MLTSTGFELPRVLTPASAARVGVSRSRMRTELRRGRWQRIGTGVVVTHPGEPTRYDWVEAGLLVGGSAAALSGWDAVHLHGLSRAVPAGATVLVLVPGGRSRRLGPLLVRRTDRPFTAQLTAAEHPSLPLAPLVAAPRAVSDAAIMTRGLGEVRRIVARAVQAGACDPADLAIELAAAPRNGSAHLRTAVAEVAAGVRSAAEGAALVHLRRSTLPEFELNVPVIDATGRLVYELDVLWRRLRAGLEVDSREYHFTRDEWQATMHRHNVLAGAGISLVHFPPSRLTGRDTSWLLEVERWLRTRAAELGAPYIVGAPGRALPRPDPAPVLLRDVIRA